MRQVKLGFTNENDSISITDYFEFTDFDIVNSLKQKEVVDPGQSLTLEASNIHSYQLDYSKKPNEILETKLSNENIFFDKLDSEVSLYKTDAMNPNAATPNSASLASVSSTARSNIVTYAIVNSSKTEPSSGNSSYAPYYVYGYPGFGHSTIVTGSYAPSYNTQYPLITSRTGDYSYNTNEILTNVYPIDGADVLAYRLIHLTAVQ